MNLDFDAGNNMDTATLFWGNFPRVRGQFGIQSLLIAS